VERWERLVRWALCLTVGAVLVILAALWHSALLAVVGTLLLIHALLGGTEA